MSLVHAQSGETIDDRPFGGVATENPSHQAGGEIVVECLEGQVAITASDRTRNLHAGELLYLPVGEPHSVKGVEHASLLLSIQDPEPNGSEENETIHARGVLLSVMQAAVPIIALALLFIVAAGNIFAGGLMVALVLALIGCMHYWVWGRWMSPTLPDPGRKEPR